MRVESRSVPKDGASEGRTMIIQLVQPTRYSLSICLSILSLALFFNPFHIIHIHSRSFITLSPLFAGAAASLTAGTQVSEQASSSSAGLVGLLLLGKGILVAFDGGLFLVAKERLCGLVLEGRRGHILALVHVDKDRRILAVLGVPMVVHRGKKKKEVVCFV